MHSTEKGVVHCKASLGHHSPLLRLSGIRTTEIMGKEKAQTSLVHQFKVELLKLKSHFKLPRKFLFKELCWKNVL